AGIYVLRWRQPKRKRPYRTLFYPVTPLIYLLITTWTIVYILIQRPEEGLLGLGLIAFGGVFYFFSAKLSQNM
ncbi:MAG: hypothetical protein QGH75_14915, partial [Pseudomonadales bacterium]|nr:hypothetical protein [Pseudomonadales bacterium]